MSREHQPEAEVFTQAHCAACRQVEAFLRKRGVVFITRDVGTDSGALGELIERGYMTTPVTRLGDEWVAGFNRRALERVLARRDRD